MNNVATYQTTSNNHDTGAALPFDLSSPALPLAEAIVAAVIALAPEVPTAIPLYAQAQWQTGFCLLKGDDRTMHILGLRLVLDALSCTPHAAMHLVAAARNMLPLRSQSVVSA